MMPSLATDLAMALDPVRLARQAGIDPDPWQAQLLRSAGPRILLNASRQSGKSTTVATLAVHTAVYQPRSLVLLVSPTLRQSGELFKKCIATYRALERPVPAEAESALQLTLANGSRIVSLPGTEQTVRGFSGVRLLIVDEASRVSDDLYYALRPMLATSAGRLVVLSTPYGKRGFFHHEWTEGGQEWERVRITAEECPRIPADWLAKERAAIPAWIFEQEYLCEFKETQDAAFRYADVMGALSSEVAPLFPLEVA